MGVYSKIIILDDHLGQLAGITAKEEATKINEDLKQAGEIIIDEFKYIPELGGIVGQIKYTPTTEILNVLQYDYVYFRQDCSGPFIRLKTE